MFSSIADGSEIIGEKKKSQERVKMFWPIVMGNEIIGGNGHRGCRNQAKGETFTTGNSTWHQKRGADSKFNGNDLRELLLHSILNAALGTLP